MIFKHSEKFSSMFFGGHLISSVHVPCIKKEEEGEILGLSLSYSIIEESVRGFSHLVVEF
jgi:hypothetical protein